MSDRNNDFTASLSEAVRRHIEGATGVDGLQRLSGGASQETWAFDATTSKGTPLPLILRRAPGGTRAEKTTAVALETEAVLIELAEKAGVPVPTVRHVLTPEDGVGQGFIMNRLTGETIARKILRDEEYAEARPKLARQCGEILARLHSIDKAKLPALRVAAAGEEIRQYHATLREHGHPHPVFELAFRWLEDNLPAGDTELTLVHGDFRNGNLMIGPDGVRGVLDWELAHIGDPMEDLGWICVNSWRFGNIDKPVGGFGTREDMFAGYEAVSGQSVDPERVKFWEVLGTLKWGIMCTSMVTAFKSGLDPSVERATIGRRSSETEIDLLRLLAPRS
ncbi:aminoglycoside phosphotransferase (APT) family kinase protein [Parvibaculum indicum]|uniref:phosphotransferase family protein n=1 Tax=Parvibaculum indicum TaxID=562969 RepID=UPI001422CCEE|nr:phosphotransferase family protein [Parvibaculum indicum]NIJ39796.1 aminoglycoside phosphotransferase (APT) family kinase protein [Parvibaculum indicum]